MADIGTQIAFISACRQMEQARSIADLFISPPVQRFTVKDFGKFDEIRQVGTEYGREVIDAWFEDFMKSEKGQSLSWLKKKSKA
jgi:lysophospholipid hydrolase